ACLARTTPEEQGVWRVPQSRLIGDAVDRASDDLDRLLDIASIAHHAGEIVVALRTVGARLDIEPEHALRPVHAPRVPRGQTEIEDQIRIVRLELEGLLIGDE